MVRTNFWSKLWLFKSRPVTLETTEALNSEPNCVKSENTKTCVNVGQLLLSYDIHLEEPLSGESSFPSVPNSGWHISRTAKWLFIPVG